MLARGSHSPSAETLVQSRQTRAAAEVARPSRCPGAVSFAAYDLERAAKNHADHDTLSALLEALKKRIGAMKAVLLEDRVKVDPVAALGAVEGRFDALLTPAAPWRVPSEMPHLPSSAALTDHSELAASLSEFPRRIAVCADDNTMRVLVTSLLVDTGATVASFGDVSELKDFDAEMCVVIFGSVISLHDLNYLPRTDTKSGRTRSYVLVGEIDPVIEQAVSKSKWATTVRLRLAACARGCLGAWLPLCA